MDKNKPVLCDNNTCTGCSACANVCPTGAISMHADNVEGFYRPFVDNQKCIGCLKCERSCPVINPINPYSPSDKIYAAWNLNPEVRNLSSSGGAFSALAQTVIDNGGVVVGASYDKDLNLSHIMISDSTGIELLRGSKYYQSYIGLIHKVVREQLKTGKEVLFCGTPCQIAGIRGFLGKEIYPNLTLVDFVCHGTPSKLFFKKYIYWATGGKSVKNFNFRDKHSGWMDALRSYFYDGSKVYLRGKKDAYWIAFNDDKNLQEACYNCKFLGEKRRSDVTVADFWGIGRKIPFDHQSEISKGVSMVMVNTKKGENMILQANKYLYMEPRTLDEVKPGNQAMFRSPKRPSARNSIYIDLNKLSFDQMVKKYMTPTFKGNLVKLFREYLPKSIILFIRSCSR